MRRSGPISRAAGSPDLINRLGEIADAIQDEISFGIGRKNRADDAPVDHPLFESPAWEALPDHARDGLRDKARKQLGTVGSGNHYVDVFVDESDAIWVGVHFGSRGLGHTIASGFLAMSQGEKWGTRVPERETLLSLDKPMGQDYWALMTLAGEYAYAGREWVARKVVSLLGGRELELVHNHHNFAWREAARRRRQWSSSARARRRPSRVRRASSAARWATMRSSCRARMRRTTRLSELQREGAVLDGARRRSRDVALAAAGKINRRTGKVIKPGAVSPRMMEDWVHEKGVILRGGGLDESPHVYRRLPDVLAAQKGTIEVLHTLRPLIVVMAGADLFDPYKD